MSKYQSETKFLRQCLLYDDTAECHKLGEGVTQAQRDERCVRRAASLMALVTALAIAGLCYATLFRANFPQNTTQFLTPFIVKVFCALGLSSLICLLSFVGLGLIYRRQLDQRREECRQVATRLLDSRLGAKSDGSLRSDSR